MACLASLNNGHCQGIGENKEQSLFSPQFAFVITYRTFLLPISL